MPALPNKLPSQISSAQSVVKAPYPQLILLLSTVLVFLLISFFILDFGIQDITKKAPTKPPINFEEVNYPSSLWKNRINRTLEAASSEKDPSKKFELYSQIFTELLAIYNTEHDPKTRKQAESMAQFLSSQFPKKYQAGNFMIPCLDLECGQPNYSEEVLKIKEEIQGIKSINPLVLESISKKFDVAAFSADPNVQWQNYLDVFQALKSEIARTNDSQIVEVTVKLKEFLKAQYPAIVDQWEKDLPDLLAI